MKIINIKIKNKTYQIACDNIDENNIKELASNIENKINDLVVQYPKASDLMLLIMNNLNTENEINELKSNKIDSDSENVIIQTIDAVSDYVETLAKKLENIYIDN